MIINVQLMLKQKAYYIKLKHSKDFYSCMVCHQCEFAII